MKKFLVNRSNVASIDRVAVLFEVTLKDGSKQTVESDVIGKFHLHSDLHRRDTIFTLNGRLPGADIIDLQLEPREETAIVRV